MAKKIYNYDCEHCGIFSEMVEYDDRDIPQKCPICGNDSARTWEGMTFDARTAKTSASFIDGTRRFDNIREDQMLKKEKAKARSKGDIKLADKIDRERKKIK